MLNGVGAKKVLKASPKQRVTIVAPDEICLYRKNLYPQAMKFFDALDREVFLNHNYVHIDFSDTDYISAAAALVLFAKITRCQCGAPLDIFDHPDKIITLTRPTDKATRNLMRNAGLWAAIRPGSQKKLDGLWSDWSNPYKSGNDPAKEISDVISLLQLEFEELPRQIIAALQEAYLNIAHHAYEKFKQVEGGYLHKFMVGRWWQCARKYPDNSISLIIYDMGAGIPSTISPRSEFPGKDSDEIHHAMQTGITRLDIQGRGMGFDNIKKPIDLNESAEYLVVYSRKGQVTYKKGHIVSRVDHQEAVGGTLIEWFFGARVK